MLSDKNFPNLGTQKLSEEEAGVYRNILHKFLPIDTVIDELFEFCKAGIVCCFYARDGTIDDRLQTTVPLVPTEQLCDLFMKIRKQEYERFRNELNNDKKILKKEDNDFRHFNMRMSIPLQRLNQGCKTTFESEVENPKKKRRTNPTVQKIETKTVSFDKKQPLNLKRKVRPERQKIN
eukprot:UN23287